MSRRFNVLTQGGVWFVGLMLCSAAIARGDGPAAAPADARTELRQAVETGAQRLEPKVIAWRRDFHPHPELGNHERRTAAIIAKHLTKLGLEVRTGVARTGVVGVLKGDLPGRVVALRADMDALPVKSSRPCRLRRVTLGRIAAQRSM